jgi:hypothetical protein
VASKKIGREARMSAGVRPLMAEKRIERMWFRELIGLPCGPMTKPVRQSSFISSVPTRGFVEKLGILKFAVLHAIAEVHQHT